MDIARVGARTTPLDPRFAAAATGAALPARAPATRILVRSRRGAPVIIEAGASISAFNEAIAAFESGGSTGGAGEPEELFPGMPLEPGRYRPTILEDGTVLPAGMTIGFRTMRVRYLKRTLKAATAERGKLMLSHGRMARTMVSLNLVLNTARSNLRQAIYDRADPGRINKLMQKVGEVEGQVSKLERDMHAVLTQVGALTTLIDDMTAELLTFGEAI